mmetsp:Transcript_141998/g.395771  ORF Transcript_141998/g.395771 Transcript_141998/m.395771 type:complete len:253 (+) Transcript_141998:393-1151(+)
MQALVVGDGPASLAQEELGSASSESGQLTLPDSHGLCGCGKRWRNVSCPSLRDSSCADTGCGKQPTSPSPGLPPPSATPSLPAVLAVELVRSWSPVPSLFTASRFLVQPPSVGVSAVAARECPDCSPPATLAFSPASVELPNDVGGELMDGRADALRDGGGGTGSAKSELAEGALGLVLVGSRRSPGWSASESLCDAAFGWMAITNWRRSSSSVRTRSPDWSPASVSKRLEAACLHSGSSAAVRHSSKKSVR